MSASVFELDLTTMTFKLLSSVGAKSINHSAILHNSNMIVYGGLYEDNGIQFNTGVRVFDINTITWTYCTTEGQITPGPLIFHRAIQYQDSMFIFGGTDNDVRNNYLFEYNILTNTWTRLHMTGDRPPPPRSSCSFTIWGERAFIMLGHMQDSRNESYDGIWRINLDTRNNARVVCSHYFPMGDISFISTSPGCHMNDKLIIFGGNTTNPDQYVLNNDLHILHFTTCTERPSPA